MEKHTPQIRPAVLVLGVMSACASLLLAGCTSAPQSGSEPRRARELQVDLANHALKSLREDLRLSEQQFITFTNKLGRLITPFWIEQARIAREKVYPPEKEWLDQSTEAQILRRRLQALQIEMTVYSGIHTGETWPKRKE